MFLYLLWGMKKPPLIEVSLYWLSREITEKGIGDEIENFTEMAIEDLQLYLINDDQLQGYLFPCLECGKYCLCRLCMSDLR